MQSQHNPKPDAVLPAVLAIIAAVFSLSLGDAIIKTFSVSFSLWQLYVMRSLFILPFLVAFIRYRYPGIRLYPVALGWAILRSLLLALMWIAYYTSLPHLPLPVAAAAYYTLPIFITLISALLIGEAVGRRGWIATISGFAGVLIILRPDADGINLYALLPILAAILYATAMVLTRTKCQGENPAILSLALNVAFVGIGGIASLAIVFAGSDGAANAFLFGQWAPLGRTEMLVLSVLAAAMLVGSLLTAYAYQAASPAIVSTFDYSYLGFSVLWGVLFFAEIPDFITLLGILIVATAGVIASTAPRATKRQR